MYHGSRNTLSPAQRVAIARTVIEKHIYGCDINPYATALTRFRLLLATCDYAHPTTLADLRDLRFNVVTIDSLIPYEKMLVDGAYTVQATQALGQPEAIERALPVLRKRYDVVVGNPPYILAQDSIKRELYRNNYLSAFRKYGLSAPFTERFLHLATVGGYVGMINSNAFARRQFGKKLIEEVLPQYDLQAIIDLGGAYIPGHGTPTLILFARNQPPSTDKVTVLANLKGEQKTPTNPIEGEVWQSVVEGFTKGHGFRNSFVDVYDNPRASLAVHPWQFGGTATRLYKRIADDLPTKLRDLADSIGFLFIIGKDDVFIHTPDVIRRLNIHPEFIRQFSMGEEVRDWSVITDQVALFPYNDKFDTVLFDQNSSEYRYLQQFKLSLNSRPTFSGTFESDERIWYEYHQISPSKFKSSRAIAFASIATHGHFVYDQNGILFNLAFDDFGMTMAK